MGPAAAISFYTGPLAHPDLMSASPATVATSPAAPVATADDRFEVTAPLTAINSLIQVLHDRATSPLIYDGEPVHYAFQGPRLIISTLRSTGEELDVSMDLRRSRFLPVSPSPKLAGQSESLQMVRGVLDGVLEGQVLEHLFDRDEARKEGFTPPFTTANLMSLALGSGQAPALVRPGGVLPADGVSAEARARLEDDLALGRWILAPPKSVEWRGQPRMAWWSLDPVTGETLGISERGLHDAVVERVLLVKKIDHDQIMMTVFFRTGLVRVMMMTVADAAFWGIVMRARAISWTIKFTP